MITLLSCTACNDTMHNRCKLNNIYNRAKITNKITKGHQFFTEPGLMWLCFLEYKVKVQAGQ